MPKFNFKRIVPNWRWWAGVAGCVGTGALLIWADHQFFGAVGNERHEPQFLGRSAETWIAIFTVFLSVSTIGLWFATHMLGHRSDKGMRTLERAYIYPILHLTSAQGVATALDAIMHSERDEAQRLDLKFAFQNLGKTPGTILAVEADLRVTGNTFMGTAHYVTEPILGAHAGSNDLTAPGLVSREEARELLVGTDAERLIFQGYVSYEDIFGDVHYQPFVWRYNRKARRLLPVQQPKSST